MSGENMSPHDTEQLAAQEKQRLKAAARMLAMGENDDLRGAMLIVADSDGVQTIPYVSPNNDPREMSLWMLGAFMAHIADAAPHQMRLMEVAGHAVSLLNDPQPDERGEYGD